VWVKLRGGKSRIKLKIRKRRKEISGKSVGKAEWRKEYNQPD
jgi:hypothetical protein